MTTFAKTMQTYKTALLGLLLSLVMISCDKDRNKPGKSYFPDMEQSQAYETYSQSPVMADGKTNQLPPKNTVPREMIPYDFEKTEVNRTWAGETLENPYKDDLVAAAEKGKRIYGIYCINCHGELGDGKGFLFSSGKFPYPPGNLLSEKIRTKPDGEIFHVITVGWGLMGAHGAQVQPDERWQVISYIRNNLQK